MLVCSCYPSVPSGPAVCPLVDVGVFLQIYRILGKTVVCYPIVFDLSDFYLSQDVMLLIDDIKVGQVVVLLGQTLIMVL